MRKMVFIDLDGTMMDENKKVSKKNIDAIDTALNKGNIISVCSGRSINGGRYAVDRLPVHENLYQIGYHGAFIRNVKNNKIIYKNPMSNEQVKKISDYALERNMFHICFSDRGIFVPNDTSSAFNIYINKVKEEYKVFNTAEDIFKTKKDIYKVMIVSFDDQDKLYDFKDKFKSIEEVIKAKSFFSSPTYLEYVKKEINKGESLKKLVEYLGEDIKNTVAIGDERNDIELIKYANIGCAMKNARNELKEVADYVTENDYNNSGVAEVIEKFVL